MINAVELVKKLDRPIRSFKPTHATVERISRAMIGEFQKNPGLKECTQQSLMMVFLQGTQWGLEFGIHCHAVPFNVKGQPTAVFMPNYQGLCELMYRTGRVSAVNADAVFANDDFRYVRGTENYIKHTAPLIGDRGQLVAAWATVTLKGEDRAGILTVLPQHAVLAIKARSKGAKKPDSPWNTDDEWKMWRKTAIKDVAHMAPRSAELIQALEMDDRAEMGDEQPFSDEVYREVEAVSVPDPLANGRHENQMRRPPEVRTQAPAPQPREPAAAPGSTFPRGRGRPKGSTNAARVAAQEQAHAQRQQAPTPTPAPVSVPVPASEPGPNAAGGPNYAARCAWLKDAYGLFPTYVQEEIEAIGADNIEDAALDQGIWARMKDSIQRRIDAQEQVPQEQEDMPDQDPEQ